MEKASQNRDASCSESEYQNLLMHCTQFGRGLIYIIIGRMLAYENGLPVILSDPGNLIFHAYIGNRYLADKVKPSCIKHMLNLNTTITQSSGDVIKKAVQCMQERLKMVVK